MADAKFWSEISFLTCSYFRTFFEHIYAPLSGLFWKTEVQDQEHLWAGCFSIRLGTYIIKLDDQHRFFELKINLFNNSIQTVLITNLTVTHVPRLLVFTPSLLCRNAAISWSFLIKIFNTSSSSVFFGGLFSWARPPLVNVLEVMLKTFGKPSSFSGGLVYDSGSGGGVVSPMLNPLYLVE